MMEVVQPLLGFTALPALAWSLSENRRFFPWRIVATSIAAQVVFTVAFFKFAKVGGFFLYLNRVSETLQSATNAGTSLVFGYLGGAPLPFEESFPGSAFILAFRSLPLIFVIAALSALLWHWRVLPAVIRTSTFALNRIFSLGGGVGPAAAANIFVGMVEAPLLIRPVFASLSRADLFLIMSCGMATIAGTVLFLYASVLLPVMPDALGHLITASVIYIPAAVVFARIMVPETEKRGEVSHSSEMGNSYSGSMDAIAQGTQQGVSLFLNIIAMLIALVALVYLCNSLLSFLPEVGGVKVTLQGIFGVVFRPLVWLIGIPWQEAGAAAALMGTKTVLNEFVAYLDFVGQGGAELSARSRLIMVYAMSGFANFGSLGIMIGGLSAISPRRRGEIAGLAMRSLVSGTFATCITGAVVAIVS